MSRSKKSRKLGSLDNTPVIVTRNRTESDVEGRLRKRLNKRKGLKTGNRHSAGKNASAHSGGGLKKDPRHGSKKPIPLVVEAKGTPEFFAKHKLSAQQELDAIQNDAQLNVLIDRLDKGEKLGAGLQSYVDEKLDRLEQLMEELGIDDELYEDIAEEDITEEEIEEAQAESKTAKKKAPLDDDDLLSQFEQVDLDEWK